MLLRWIESYISNRIQLVKVGSCLSSPIHVTSGVPQGSHLGPVLFLLFINGIGRKFSSKFLLFADDVKIFRQINSDIDCRSLQDDLNVLQAWCIDNNMHVNVTKCNSIRFSKRRIQTHYQYVLDGNSLPVSDTVMDLGVCFDSKYTFNNHVDMIVCKALRALDFVTCVTKDFSGCRCMTVLYCSLVRSVLEYCYIIWSPVLTFIKFALYEFKDVL